MRNKIVAVLFGLLLLPSAGKAQQGANVVVPLAEGGFVAFKNQTASIDALKAAKTLKSPSEFSSKAFIGSDGVVHRVLVDAAGNYVFGYDVVIRAVAASKTFSIAVKPLDLKIENKPGTGSPEGEPAPIATLMQSSEPQILDDGDSFALDLLVNNESGIKIIDLVRVSFDRSSLTDDSPGMLPRDFTLDAVALTVSDYRLLIDGDLIAAGKPGTTFAGSLIWCYVEGHGRFIFSLTPRDGYQFKKVGIITENRIEFTVAGKHFEWLSDSPVLPSGGVWNLWVLHDPKYQPFGSREKTKKEKSKLDQLDDSIKAAQNKATRIGDALPTTFKNKTDEVAPNEPPIRFKVMVGAADRIENLWPKNQ